MSNNLRAMTAGGLAAVAALAMLVSGCGSNGSGSSTEAGTEKPTNGGVLHAGWMEEVITLNPDEALELGSVNAVGQIFEPLFLLKPDGKLEPRLVTSTKKSADLRTWTFKLRQGVKFSDGKPMTAADVAFSINSARTNLYYAGLFEEFEQVTATSPSTVVVKTKKPFPAMISNLALYVTDIVPKNYGGVSGKQFGQHPIGTGPFMVSSWKQGGAMTLVPNPHYWESGKPYLDKVVIEAVPDDSSRISQLRAGGLDVIAGPASQLGSLEQTPGITVGKYAEAVASGLLLNRSTPLFADPRVREAVNLALDRDGIVKVALEGVGSPARSFIPSPILYSDQDIKPPTRDVAKAKQLLAEAIKDDGSSPNFTLLTSTGNDYENLASQIIQSNLEEVGFGVTLQALDASAALERSGDGKFDAFLAGYVPGAPDPTELTVYMQGVMGAAGAELNEYEMLAAEAAAEVDPAKRRQLYDDIQELVAKENVMIMLNYAPFIWTAKSNVVGFAPNLLNFPWLAEAGFSAGSGA